MLGIILLNTVLVTGKKIKPKDNHSISPLSFNLEVFNIACVCVCACVYMHTFLGKLPIFFFFIFLLIMLKKVTFQVLANRVGYTDEVSPVNLYSVQIMSKFYRLHHSMTTLKHHKYTSKIVSILCLPLLNL